MNYSLSKIVKCLVFASFIAGATYYYTNLNALKNYKASGVPVLTTAGIIHTCPENRIILIERGKAPLGLAMFGGHIESKEAPQAAFKRELMEELNINQIEQLKLIGVHGDYGRDPRQHSVEITYSAATNMSPKAGSDARAVQLISIQELQEILRTTPEKFAFDHANILQQYLINLKSCNPCQENCQ